MSLVGNSIGTEVHSRVDIWYYTGNHPGIENAISGYIDRTHAVVADSNTGADFKEHQVANPDDFRGFGSGPGCDRNTIFNLA